MPAQRSLPGITIAAAVGSLATRVYDSSANQGPMALLYTFLGLWTAFFVVSSLYLMFIYPFYISPIRHLPTPRDAHWYMGHSHQLLSAIPGAPSRLW